MGNVTPQLSTAVKERSWANANARCGSTPVPYITFRGGGELGCNRKKQVATRNSGGHTLPRPGAHRSTGPTMHRTNNASLPLPGAFWGSRTTHTHDTAARRGHPHRSGSPGQGRTHSTSLPSTISERMLTAVLASHTRTTASAPPVTATWGFQSKTSRTRQTARAAIQSRERFPSERGEGWGRGESCATGLPETSSRQIPSPSLCCAPLPKAQRSVGEKNDRVSRCSDKRAIVIITRGLSGVTPRRPPVARFPSRRRLRQVLEHQGAGAKTSPQPFPSRCQRGRCAGLRHPTADKKVRRSFAPRPHAK